MIMTIPTTRNAPFVPNPSCNIPINPDIQCGEEWNADHDNYDDDAFYPGQITFHVILPTMRNCKLKFSCRDKSSGVLLSSEPALVPNAEENDTNDPFFFEKGFYLEAKTGFQPWPGTRLMVEAFACMENERMKYWQTRLANNDLTILEVGAGCGIVGTCLAAVGAKVLVTDLPVLVEHSIRPNLKRNGNVDDVFESNNNDCDFFLNSHEYSHIEKGWAQAVVLDWLIPISEQLPQSTSSAIDVVIACDCLFLRKLIDPLLSILSTLFQYSLKSPKFLFTFQQRNMKGVFISLDELIERIEDRGWSVECIAWRPVAVDGDGEQDLYLFEVHPGILTQSNALTDSISHAQEVRTGIGDNEIL